VSKLSGIDNVLVVEGTIKSTRRDACRDHLERGRRLMPWSDIAMNILRMVNLGVFQHVQAKLNESVCSQSRLKTHSPILFSLCNKTYPL